MSISRTRSFVFTLNNYNDADVALISSLYTSGYSTYYVFGREVGDSGTPHLQGFIQLRNPTTIRSLSRRMDGRAHLEQRRGTIAQAVAYCSKTDHAPTSEGTQPLDSSAKGAKEKGRWAAIISLAKDGDLAAIEELYPTAFLHQYATINRIMKDYMKAPPNLTELDNHWFTGPTGTGKSRHARERWGESLFIKNSNKWWDGYQGEETVLIDELELDAGKYMGHFLKIWGDRYAFNAEIKGSAALIRPLRIIVCSNYSIDQIWIHDLACAKAVARRFPITVFGAHAFNPYALGVDVAGVHPND